MGWKASIIIINSEENFNKDEVFESLGYYKLKKVDEQYFESVINPDDGKIYIGKYKGNTIICLQDLPLESLEEHVSKTETVFSNRFPNCEIATFILHSVVNLWGYSITKNNNKLRVRGGSSETGTMIEYGSILEEEKELLSKSSLNEKGQRIFKFEDMPEEEFLDDQIGEDFVFDISKRYIKERLDECDELLFETKFVGYTFRKKKNTWWKFW